MTRYVDWVPTLPTATRPGASDFLSLVQGGASRKYRPQHLFFDVTDYGALPGGGTSANRTGIANACAAAVAAGGGVVYFPPGAYDIGTEAGGREVYIFDLTGANNVHLYSPGCLIQLESTLDEAQNGPVLFSFANANFCSATGIRVEDSGADWKLGYGVSAFVYQTTAEAAGTDYSGLRLTDCHTDGAFHLLLTRTAFGASVYEARVRDILVDGCSATDTSYAINCVDNGDHVKSRNLRTFNNLRPVFVYGVTDHDHDYSIDCDEGGAGNLISGLNVARVRRDTSRIKARLTTYGNITNNSYSPVQIIMAPLTGFGTTGIINGVDLDIGIQCSAASTENWRNTVSMRFFDNDDNEQTSTASTVTNVSIRGDFSNLSLGTDEVIEIGAVQTGGQPLMFLDPSVARAADRTAPDYKNFAVKTSADSEFYTLNGDLTSQKFVLKGLGNIGENAITLRCVIQATDGGLDTNHSAREDIVVVKSNSAGTTLVVVSQVTTWLTNDGTAIGAVYAGNGADLEVTLSGAAYSSGSPPSSFAKLTVQYIGIGPVRGR
jgi:hypothetical protein